MQKYSVIKSSVQHPHRRTNSTVYMYVVWQAEYANYYCLWKRVHNMTVRCWGPVKWFMLCYTISHTHPYHKMPKSIWLIPSEAKRHSHSGTGLLPLS